MNNFHSLETGETSKSKVKVLVDLVAIKGGLWFAAPLQPHRIDREESLLYPVL